MHLSEEFTAFEHGIGGDDCDGVFIQVGSKVKLFFRVFVHDLGDFRGDGVVGAYEAGVEELPGQQAGLMGGRIGFVVLGSAGLLLVFRFNVPQILLVLVLIPVFHSLSEAFVPIFILTNLSSCCSNGSTSSSRLHLLI
jgi:hypothetical protein